MRILWISYSLTAELLKKAHKGEPEEKNPASSLKERTLSQACNYKYSQFSVLVNCCKHLKSFVENFSFLFVNLNSGSLFLKSNMETENYILCIGQEDDDCTFMSHAVSRINPAIQVKYEYVGIEGITYLVDKISNISTLPLLIVIDLDMPGMNGMETFSHIRANPKLKNIPIVFWSGNPEDMEESFLAKHGVTIFHKPNNMDGYNRIAETIIYSLI